MDSFYRLANACPPQTTGTPAMGQTNVSYTLMADISSLFFTKLLNYMRDNDMAKVRTWRLNHITVYTERGCLSVAVFC